MQSELGIQGLAPEGNPPDSSVGIVKLISPEQAQACRPFAFNQGFYNLFLAAGALGGAAVCLATAGPATAATAIVLFSCACMAAAGVVLIVTDRRMLPAALIQLLPPAAALVLAAL